MDTYDGKPRLTLVSEPPVREARFEAERLRNQGASAWLVRVAERERRRAYVPVPPPGPPSAA